MTVTATCRESDENYGAVIARLNERWRVIVCKDGIQWILQSAKKSGHTAVWRGQSYVRTREALIRLCAHHAGQIDATAALILNALPERLR